GQAVRSARGIHARTGADGCRRAAAATGRTQAHRGRRQPGPHRGQHPMTTTGNASRVLMVAACTVALAGCSTIKGWFGADEDDRPTEPAALVEFAPSATVTKVWSARAGDGEGRLGARQGPAI